MPPSASRDAVAAPAVAATVTPPPALPDPKAPHVRQTTLLAGIGWRWADDRDQADPTCDLVLSDKIAEHGLAEIIEIIGLSRVAILAVADGTTASLGSMILVQGRINGLARLDERADARKAKAKAG